ncbi:MAG: response regulator [Eubacteriales bacterium]|nr:response regulator [Eubacteriales bacterium]
MGENTQKIILAVDDEPLNIRMIQFVMKDERNYKLVCTNSGKEALSLLEEQNIDLVLLDVKMPEMDGFETLEKIQEKYSVPVVFLTADQDAETIQRAADMGVKNYLSKPFLPADLKKIVKAVLDE